MKDNLKMYDVVTVDNEGNIPELHFKYLSAMFRVTLRNETGEDIYPTKLEFKYPGTQSFFNTTMYFSVEGNNSDGFNLRVYEDNEFFNGSAAYTDNIGSTVNGKDGTTDIGSSIPNGGKYDLYLTTVPRIGNTIQGQEGLIITLIKSHKTNSDETYSITIPDFKKPVEAGKRYWFDLTAVGKEIGERKLILTESGKAHSGQLSSN